MAKGSPILNPILINKVWCLIIRIEHKPYLCTKTYEIVTTMNKLLATFTMIFFAAISVATAQNPNAPTIEFKTLEHNFNKLEHKGDASYFFEFKNTGKVPLILTSVNPSCGCTTPEWSKEPIAPGKTGKIKVTYNSQIVGVFTKLVYVYSNATTSMVTLTIKGEILPPKQ